MAKCAGQSPWPAAGSIRNAAIAPFEPSTWEPSPSNQPEKRPGAGDSCCSPTHYNRSSAPDSDYTLAGGDPWWRFRSHSGSPPGFCHTLFVWPPQESETIIVSQTCQVAAFLYKKTRARQHWLVLINRNTRINNRWWFFSMLFFVVVIHRDLVDGRFFSQKTRTPLEKEQQWRASC